jgi:hypothetical protein
LKPAPPGNQEAVCNETKLEGRLAKLEVTTTSARSGLLVVHRGHDSEEDFERRLQKLKAERPCPPELVVIIREMG